MRPPAAYTLFGLLLGGALLGQQPRLQNARMESRPASSRLEAVFRPILAAQAAPAWIGYAVPVVAGERQMCCFSSDSCCGGCRLEGHGGAISGNSEGPRTVQLEGATNFFVLFRVEQKRVTKIRSFSADCTLDAGGLPFFWLTGVRPAQSVALLESFVKASDGAKEDARLADSAIAAIAMHRDNSADAAFDRFAAPTAPERLRRKATFWLGNAGGRHGYEVLMRVVRDDPSDRVREAAIFGLTQSQEPAAVNAIVGVAKEDRSPRVRGQALFWLAQKAGRQISEAAIREAIEHDPDTEVKRKAVFALTQIAHGDGVPLLIEVARTNRNAAVRKQAMFWLGQSKDPRAVQFFEEVLTSNR